jgi:hypothetical protein
MIKDSHYCKMTDNHIFVKHSRTKDIEWMVVSFKETELCTINKGKKALIPAPEESLQHIVSDGGSLVGIYAKAQPTL